MNRLGRDAVSLAVGQSAYMLGRYNIGRDQVVGNLTGTTIEPRTVTNQSTFSGSTSFANYTYQTDVAYVSGLLSNSSGTSSTLGSGVRLTDGVQTA